MSASKWSFGDRVTHADRPEWGEGEITAIQPIIVEGRPSHRLTIRFERAGIKKLATSVANIKPAGDQAPVAGPASAEPEINLDDNELAAKLERMPEDAIDPFISLEKRFEFTLKLYRFSDQGGSLLDWAAMQTGLADPLTRFLRHDLEMHFAKFRRNLDRHTGALASQVSRQSKQTLRDIADKAPNEGQQALRRILAKR
ncbi:MAG: DUF3553 domain-containing protein [Phycisphaera sp.]|nr:MAG: DUF3553 domain-containing protein [Phycisphaera sp.]